MGASRIANFRWAIVGRDKERVESVKRAIKDTTGSCDAETFTCSSEDQVINHEAFFPALIGELCSYF
jgi:hypothetical protein